MKAPDHTVRGLRHAVINGTTLVEVEFSFVLKLLSGSPAVVPYVMAKVVGVLLAGGGLLIIASEREGFSVNPARLLGVAGFEGTKPHRRLHIPLHLPGWQ